MSDRLDELDYYTLLQIEPDATTDQVREAFHRFALRYHPDNHGASAEHSARATAIYRRGAEAYRVLCDVEARRRYDEGLRKGELRLVAGEQERRVRKRASSSVTSLKARPFWSKAQAAIKTGDWKTAKLNLQIALQHEPQSPLLKAKLEEVIKQLDP